MVGIGCLFCKNNKLSANYKEKSGKPLVVILLILLHTFHLPCPNYSGTVSTKTLLVLKPMAFGALCLR